MIFFLSAVFGSVLGGCKCVPDKVDRVSSKNEVFVHVLRYIVVIYSLRNLKAWLYARLCF